MEPVSRLTAPHYRWGSSCDGWRLLDRTDLSVIEERIPPGAGEARHVHGAARQLFYVLRGRLEIEGDAGICVVDAGQACEVPPGAPHRVRNTSGSDAWFLVISAPSTRNDRVDL